MIRVVAEAGQCMEGDVGLACRMAEAAARAGASHFKVQMLRPETIAIEHAAKYWTDELGTANQREAFERAGVIPYDAWGPVVDVCRQVGIEWCATPFDLDAVEAMREYRATTYKIASGDLTYAPLLRAVAPVASTVLLSTGASTLDEVRDAVWTVVEHARAGTRIVLLACSLVYPTPAPYAQIRRIGTLGRFAEHAATVVPSCRFELGYSDHTLQVGATAAVAVGAGATWLEKHYTHSRSGRDVADHAMAVDPAGLEQYVQAAQLAEAMLGDGSLGVTRQERAAHVGARRSLWLARDVEPGDTIRAEDVLWLRPATGTPAEMAALFIGQQASRAAAAGRPLGEAF